MNQRATEEVRTILDGHRTKLLNRILWLFVVITFPVLVVGMINRPANIIIPVMLFAPVIIAAFFPGVGLRPRALSLVLFVFATGGASLIINGVHSAGRALGILLVILVSLFFELRAVAVVFATYTAMLIGIGTLVVNGHMEVKAEAQELSADPYNWLFYGAVFIGAGIVSCFAIQYLLASLVEHLAHLKQESVDKDLARAAEQRTAEQYRLLAENVHDVIWTMGLDGKMTYISPSVERMQGITPEQSQNVEVGDLLAVNKTQDMMELLWEELAHDESGRGGRDGYRTIETQLVRADGSTFDAEIVTTFIRDGEGKPTGVLGVTRDITDRRKLEHQLQQSQKMESVGQLAGGVAHGFNNLLQAILGYAELAASKTGPDSEVSDDIRQIVNAGGRAKSLVRQLLAFSRRQVLSLEVTNLESLVNGVLMLLQRVIGEEISLTYEPAHEEDQVQIDSGQIEQVLMNLCVNARDTMPNGGLITIQTRNADLDSRFCAGRTWARPGRYVLMSVTDTGTGIDEQTLEHIFEPFFTCKEQGKGTGLGLSTVFGIVRQHNGLIRVESTVGQGTTFEVYLPLVAASTTSDTAESEALSTEGTETILLADDDELVRKVVKIILERHGYTVHVVSDGNEAIAYYDAHAGEIDLLVLDIVMPNVGGRLVAEYVLGQNPEMPILFLTGYETREHDDEMDASRDVEILEKPFHNNVLLQRIRQRLDRPHAKSGDT